MFCFRAEWTTTTHFSLSLVSLRYLQNGSESSCYHAMDSKTKITIDVSTCIHYNGSPGFCPIIQILKHLGCGKFARRILSLFVLEPFSSVSHHFIENTA